MSDTKELIKFLDDFIKRLTQDIVQLEVIKATLLGFELSKSTPTPPDNLLAPVAEIDVHLTQYLINFMQKNNPNSHILRGLTEKRQLNWFNDCRLMREVDKRTPEEIQRVIKYSQEDTFWKGNILSMSKLRKQFDQLWIKSKPEPTPGEKIDAWAKKRKNNE